MSHVFRCFTMSGRNLSEKRVCFKRSKQVGGVLCKMRVKCDIRALSLNQSCLYLRIKYQFGFRLLVAMGIAIWLPQHVIQQGNQKKTFGATDREICIAKSLNNMFLDNHRRNVLPMPYTHCCGFMHIWRETGKRRGTA